MAIRKTHRVALREFGSFADAEEWVRDYSALKFGSDSAARKFGYRLADRFFDQHSAHLISRRCVVIPSPYNFVPNAATILARHFADRLNHRLTGAKGGHIEWSIIHRKVSYTNDYGFLPQDQRRKLIENDLFYFNRDFLAGKTLIFVDDVLITGTHEEKLIDLMDKAEMPNETFFVYFGHYLHGGSSPEIEAQINFARVKTLEDYLELSHEEGHHIIVRPIKFLLTQPASDFERIAKEFAPRLVRDIYSGALGEGYYRIPDYQRNFGILRERYAHLQGN